MGLGCAGVPVWFHSSMPANEPAILTAPRRPKSILGKLEMEADARGRAAASRSADVDAARTNDVGGKRDCGRCR